MAKILKLTAISLGLVLLLGVLGIIGIVTFVSPNRLKPILEDKVMKSTGRQLVIDGDMSWSFFPYLGVKVGHMVLGNPATFSQKTFAEISSATVGVKLMPLMRGRIESSGLTLVGMQLNLIKNKNGQVNWQFLAAPTNNAPTTSTSDTNRKSKINLAVANIHIDNANVMYLDEQSNQSYRIKNFSLRANNINLMEPFSMKSSFDFVAKQPAMSGHVDLTGKMALNTNVQIYSFRELDCEAQIQQDNKNIKLNMTGAVIADLNAKTLLNGLTAQGNLTIDALQAAKIHLDHINVKMRFQNGVLNLAPFSAKLYQGNLAGQAKVNLNSSAPQISLQAKLADVQAQPLLQDLGSANQKLTISGTSDVDLQVTTAGTESKAIMRNLNGTSRFSFSNGAVIGIDLGYLVDSAYATLKNRPMPENHNQTNFGSLTGSAVIRNGLLANNDLLSDSPRFATNGKGTIDLVNQKIDYSLQTNVKKRSADDKDGLGNLYGIAIPVLITGNLASPSIRLDTATIAKAVAKQQIDKISDQAKTKLQEEIKKQIPGKAGDVLNSLLGN